MMDLIASDLQITSTVFCQAGFCFDQVEEIVQDFEGIVDVMGDRRGQGPLPVGGPISRLQSTIHRSFVSGRRAMAHVEYIRYV